MATFMAYIQGVGIKYVPVRDKDKEVIGSDPVVEVKLQAVGADEHALADHLGEMMGKRVKANILAEQPELSNNAASD